MPDEKLYSYMVHCVAKSYGISKIEAAKYTEFDFWEMTAFDNLDSKKEEYLMKQKSE